MTLYSHHNQPVLFGIAYMTKYEEDTELLKQQSQPKPVCFCCLSFLSSSVSAYCELQSRKLWRNLKSHPFFTCVSYAEARLSCWTSVRHTLVLCRNGLTYRQTVFTAW